MIGVIDALDHPVGLLTVPPGAVEAVAVVGVVQGQQQGAVALLRGGQRLGQRWPVGVGVQRRVDGDVGHEPREGRTVRGGGQRLGVDLQHHPVEGAFGVTIVVERAVHVGRAVGEERRQGVLEADALLEVPSDTVGGGILGAVEHGGPHRVGEQRRPRRAELRAVAEPEVADLSSPSALRIESMSRAELLVPTNWRMSPFFSTQCVDELVEQTDDLVALGLVVRGDVGAGVVLVVVVDAVDRRRAAARPPRVPPDDVEGVEQRPGRRSGRRSTARSVPPAPGPPGLTSSEPTRSPVAR